MSIVLERQVGVLRLAAECGECTDDDGVYSIVHGTGARNRTIPGGERRRPVCRPDWVVG